MDETMFFAPNNVDTHVAKLLLILHPFSVIGGRIVTIFTIQPILKVGVSAKEFQTTLYIVSKNRTKC